MGKPACTGSALPQVQRRTNRVYRSLIGSALCRTAGSTVSGLGGSGGGLGGLGGDWDILDTLCLVRFRKPRTVQLAGSHLLFCPDQDFLGSPLALLPLRELLKDSGVLREPLDLLEQVAEVGNLGHALRAAVLLDKCERISRLRELECGGVLGDDLLHCLDCLREGQSAALGIIEQLVPRCGLPM